MDKQKQDDQLEPIYNSSVPIQGVVLKTYQERWMIETGGERGSGRSVLAAQDDDDVNDTEKIWIFPARARLIVHLNDQFILNRSYVNDTSAVAITPSQVFC